MTVTLDDFLAFEQGRYLAKLRAKKPRAPRDPAAVKPKRGNPERTAQRAVVAWLRKAGVVVNASVNEQAAASADKAQRARFGMARKASGVTTGFPDLTCITQEGRVFFIEMKSAVGKLSDAQRDLHAAMEARGQIVILGRDVWSVQDALAARGVFIGSPVRRAAP